jgi:hypothetical protein
MRSRSWRIEVACHWKRRSATRRMLRAVRTYGIKEVWQEVEQADLSVPGLLWIAQGLSANGRDDDNLWLRFAGEPLRICTTHWAFPAMATTRLFFL